jgi:hypothetical protein
MLLRRSLFAALVCAIGLASFAAARDDKKDDKDKKPADTKTKTLLAWKLEKDKPFFQKMTTVTKQTMKVQNQDVVQTQTQTFFFKFTPTKVEGDTYTVEQIIEGVQMDIDIGGTKISYDSTKQPDSVANPLGEFFKALVNQKFTLTLAPKDKDSKELTVTKIEGREAFVAALGNANPQMKQLLNQILSEAALKEMAQPTFAALPGVEKAPGDTWERTSTLDMGPIGKYENKYVYKYMGPDAKADKSHLINVETTLKYKEPTAEGGAGGLPFRIKKANLKSDPSKGTILFDPALGRITNTNVELKLTGDLEIEIGGQTTKVDLEQTQTTTVENTSESQLPKPVK